LQRLLRDDPAKGITAIKEPANWTDVRDAWSDNSMWGLYFLGLVCIVALLLRFLYRFASHPFRSCSLKKSLIANLSILSKIAYIPATPVQGYLSLTLRKLGFSVFDSNMLSIPSAVLQIILMLALAKSSEHFNERTFHCFIGEFWSLPLLAALLGLPPRGHAWGRFTLTTMVSGCKSLLLPF
jgi:hypothetical protein